MPMQAAAALSGPSFLARFRVVFYIFCRAAAILNKYDWGSWRGGAHACGGVASARRAWAVCVPDCGACATCYNINTATTASGLLTTIISNTNIMINRITIVTLTHSYWSYYYYY